MALVSSLCNNVVSLPSSYIMPPETRPGKYVTICKDLPVIDLSAPGQSRADLVQQIIQASQKFGIFQVINHGVSESIMKEIMNLSKAFFNMPDEEKSTFYSEDFTKSSRLYTSGANFATEDSHFWRDTLKHPCHPLDQHISSWPDKPTNYREVAGPYSVEVRKLGLRILELICEGLGLKKGYFNGDLSDSQEMVMNYYPPCPDPSLAMGAPAHCDVNLLTLLQQEVYGLQIFQDNQWMGVEPLPNAFIVNIGYQLEVISNGKLKSAEHRGITNISSARTSIVTFISPIPTAVIQPGTELLTSTNLALYRPFTFREFLMNFLAYLSKKEPRAGTPLDAFVIKA